MLFWRRSIIRGQTAIRTLCSLGDRKEKGERKMESLAALFLYNES